MIVEKKKNTSLTVSAPTEPAGVVKNVKKTENAGVVKNVKKTENPEITKAVKTKRYYRHRQVEKYPRNPRALKARLCYLRESLYPRNPRALQARLCYLRESLEVKHRV